ncbi:MAG: dynamin family protein [Clostridia bacterium]|nr:dynamin family protein [Clostridia bacterium]
MTKIYLKYNPFTLESEIKIDGIAVQHPNKLADLTNERLQVWVENLLPILNEVCNDDSYEIDFYGTDLDYGDLLSCVNDYCEKDNSTEVKINFTEAKGSEDRFKELIALFNDMQQNCPFEDLTTEQIKENFNAAISSEFEVSVIATLSSGKSTLINSLLGRELMPSKNEACTATIAKIKDMDGLGGFNATYLDKDKNVIGSFQNLTLENMSEMNDNPNTAYINIQGDIPNIQSKGVQLVLVDTPGPNNSRTEDHKNHTYRIIKEKSKPMVLYVLNATQLATNDDKELLTAVSEAMRVGGKQSKDRFLFAVNKVDLFDPDKESVKGAIQNVKNYLQNFDIENPNIFPISAEMAKVIRMNNCGQALTSQQKRTLRDHDFFIDEEQLHLSEQATLSRNNINKVKAMAEEAKSSDDSYAEALIYTGVPAIELAINEYLEKYAYTAKVKTAVDTFKKKVEEKDMHAKMMESIQKDETARERINLQLVQVGRQIEEGKASDEFRNRIKKLDMMNQADERFKL